MILSRRSLLKLGAVVAGCGLGAWQVRRPGPAAVAAPAAVESASSARRLLIVNADDFGMADDINRGIVEAHVHGIVTSTSLLTTWPGAEAAARLAAGYPELSVGLHVDLDGIEPIGASRRSLDAVGEEIERQLGIFRRLMGRLPTHIDSHHHVHLRFNVARVFLDISERYGFPLRGFSRVMYIGGFYGQWPTGRSDLARISPAALMALLGDVGPGLSQLGCHPGYFAPSVADPYRHEREVELRSLSDARVREAIDRQSITLVSYADYPRLVAGTGRLGSEVHPESRQP